MQHDIPHKPQTIKHSDTRTHFGDLGRVCDAGFQRNYLSVSIYTQNKQGAMVGEINQKGKSKNCSEITLRRTLQLELSAGQSKL